MTLFPPTPAWVSWAESSQYPPWLGRAMTEEATIRGWGSPGAQWPPSDSSDSGSCPPESCQPPSVLCTLAPSPAVLPTESHEAGTWPRHAEEQPGPVCQLIICSTRAGHWPCPPSVLSRAALSLVTSLPSTKAIRFPSATSGLHAGGQGHCEVSRGPGLGISRSLPLLVEASHRPAQIPGEGAGGAGCGRSRRPAGSHLGRRSHRGPTLGLECH